MESQITWVNTPSKVAINEQPKRWTVQAIEDLFALPFNDLVFKAQSVHRENFNPNEGATFYPAVDQDRWLPRRLLLLSTIAPGTTQALKLEN